MFVNNSGRPSMLLVYDDSECCWRKNVYDKRVQCKYNINNQQMTLRQ